MEDYILNVHTYGWAAFFVLFTPMIWGKVGEIEDNFICDNSILFYILPKLESGKLSP